MNTFKSYLAGKIVSIDEGNIVTNDIKNYKSTSKLYSKYKFTFSYKNKKLKIPIADYYNYRYKWGKSEYGVIADIAKELGLRKGREHLVKIEQPKASVPVPSDLDIVIVNNKPYVVGAGRNQINHRDGNISLGAVSVDEYVEDVFKNKYSRVMLPKRIDLYSDVDKIIKKDSSEYKKLISKIKKNKGLG